MSISHTDIGDNLRKIVILGRLDIPGTESVADQLEKLAAAPKKGVIVDLSRLQFLTSIGIRAAINRRITPRCAAPRNPPALNTSPKRMPGQHTFKNVR